MRFSHTLADDDYPPRLSGRHLTICTSPHPAHLLISDTHLRMPPRKSHSSSCLSRRLRLRLWLSPSAVSFGFLMRLHIRLLLRLRLVSSGFVLLKGTSRSPSSGFVLCTFAIKVAWVLSSCWSSCCPTLSSSSSVPHHPFHPLCSRLCPWCHGPCAVHLCLLAQETWRSSSSCVGVLLESGYTQVQSSLAAPP